MEDAGFSTPLTLTPLDHTVVQLYISYFLSFKTSTPESSLQHLRDGVTRLFTNIPFLSGDVVVCADLNGKKNVRQVHPSNLAPEDEAFLQVKHHPSASISSIKTPAGGTLSPDSEDIDQSAYLALREYSPLPLFLQTKARPVLRFKANIMKDGIVLGMSFNHSVFDGTGSGLVLELLADCCRISDGVTDFVSKVSENELRLRQAVLDNAVTEIESQQEHIKEYGETTFIPDLSPEELSGLMASLATMFNNRSFSFSQTKIEQLKQACSVIIQSAVETKVTLSDNDVLTALLATCVSRARAESPGPPPSTDELVMAVGLHKRFQRPIFENYLGIFMTAIRASINSTAPQLQNASMVFPTNNEIGLYSKDLIHVANVALQLRQGITSLDEERVQSLISFLQTQEDWDTVNAKPADVNISSWRHLKVYSLDFGAGLGFIDAFEMNFGVKDSVCIVMPKRVVQPDKVGEDVVEPSWDVHITLKHDKFEKLLGDRLFSWALE